MSDDVPLTIDVLKKKQPSERYLSINELLKLIQNTDYNIHPIIEIRYVGRRVADTFAEPNRKKGLIRQGEVLGIDVEKSKDDPGRICVKDKDCYLPNDWHLYDDYGNEKNLVLDDDVKIFRYIDAPVDCNAVDKELQELAKELGEESVKKEKNDKIIREIYEDISNIKSIQDNCKAGSGGKSRKTKRGKTRRNKRRSSRRRR